LQQRGKLLFIRFIHESMGQYIPQVLICLVRVNGKKLGMVFHEERIDTAFSSGKTAAAGHGGVNLILGNEVLNSWHLGKVRRKGPAW